MTPITIMEDEFAGLWYHPDSNVVHHEIRRFLPRGFFEKILATGADYLEEHRGQKWRSDNRSSVMIAEVDPSAALEATLAYDSGGSPTSRNPNLPRPGNLHRPRW